MRIIVIDVSGKVLNYDYGLCQELNNTTVDVAIAAHRQGGDHFTGKRIPLLRLIPLKYKNSTSILKRLIKAFEGVLNYTWLLIVIMIKSPHVLHFQWFPFMEFCGIENGYVELLHKLFPSIKIVHTIHNVYPHDMKLKERMRYCSRFKRMEKHICHFIVHTENTKQEVQTEFGIEKDRISVIHHGIFCPDFVCEKERNPVGRHIIMYGNNLPYKGADILLDALHLLPKDERLSISTEIVGTTPLNYLEQLKSKAEGLNVRFVPSYIPDNELYQLIDRSDYIALPYRQISQSGVLLLALYFKKPLLVSDLPSFKETLQGFSDDMFFEANNAESLSQLIHRHLKKEIDVEKQMAEIKHLNELYSWGNTAKATSQLYMSLD